MNAQALFTLGQQSTANMLKDNEFMSLLDAANALGITRQGLWARVRKGTAPAHVTVGGRTIFERADVERQTKNTPARGGSRSPTGTPGAGD